MLDVRLLPSEVLAPKSPLMLPLLPLLAMFCPPPPTAPVQLPALLERRAGGPAERAAAGWAGRGWNMRCECTARAAACPPHVD